MAMYAHLAHLSVYEVNLKHMRECSNLIIHLRVLPCIKLCLYL